MGLLGSSAVSLFDRQHMICYSISIVTSPFLVLFPRYGKLLVTNYTFSTPHAFGSDAVESSSNPWHEKLVALIA